VTFTATVTPAIGSGESGTVQFQVNGNNAGSPAPLSGNAATYTTSAVAAGSDSVVAVYSGDSSFTGSTSNTLTQNVGKANLAITADNDSKTYGTSKSFSGTAFTETGLVTANGDSITGVSGSSAGSAALATVGSYAIVPSAAVGSGLNNYTINYVSGVLTVTPEVISVTSTQTMDSLETSGNVQFTIGSGGDLTVNNTITLDSGGAISVVQSGRVTVPGINSQSGATGINLDSGTLRAGADFTTTAPITVGAGGGTIDANGYNPAFAGTLTGSGGLTTTGAGIVTLSGTNTYTGGTTIDAGVITATSSASVPPGGAVVLAGGNLVLNFGAGGGSVMADASASAADISQGGASETAPSSNVEPISAPTQTASLIGHATATSRLDRASPSPPGHHAQQGRLPQGERGVVDGRLRSIQIAQSPVQPIAAVATVSNTGLTALFSKPVATLGVMNCISRSEMSTIDSPIPSSSAAAHDTVLAQAAAPKSSASSTSTNASLATTIARVAIRHIAARKVGPMLLAADSVLGLW
jgi:autotransporter-associated beta strand protein